MKRKYYFLLAAGLFLFFLIGCSSNENASETQDDTEGDQETAESGEEGATVTVFKSHMGKGTIPESDDPHVQYVKDKTGVEYQLMTTPPGSEPAEYINLMIASEDFPDILRPIGGVEQTLINQGGALALDDLLPEYAPNVWERIPEEAWNIVRSASPDGKIYYVPKVYLIPERAALLRQDWLDAVGIEMPETIEDYKEMLIAFRDQDPNGNGQQDELPTSGREFGRWMDHLFAMFGVAMWEGYPEWDIYNGEINYAGTSENMKEAIKFIRDLYAEGLLDNETFLNKGDVWTAKINNNLVGSWYHLPANLKERYAAMKEGAPDAYVVGMPLPEVEGFDGFITQKSMGEPEWMIPAASEDNAINSLKLLDFFYDPANADFVQYGIEGVQHEVVDGEKVLLPSSDDKPLALGMLNLTTDESMNIRIENSFSEEEQEMVKDIFEVSKADARRIAGDGLPSTVYEGYPDIQSHKLFQEYLTKIVIGEWPIEKFDEFVDRWYQSGGEEVTQRVQEWYDTAK
ncbi:ABC-type glycerol-3-phosphate transport system, substrate-binding protein [Gracilibacillus ureilyticus]|uniref:ABC-type glycerol-3-phosphate transport system, substrate-binding protein n=1 Tax=Gracilibacillus ureilyticus TaxID=531814 RepID=A0A1H9NHU7_9BACI|nr:extracellular solute-binding protein [Gracilibacillus ureilyticus]SER35471.1 ABC-type glycerol-3-phosphate transport system, substrate-binding protein [Gracilibacillus ureilyticus]